MTNPSLAAELIAIKKYFLVAKPKKSKGQAETPPPAKEPAKAARANA